MKNESIPSDINLVRTSCLQLRSADRFVESPFPLALLLISPKVSHIVLPPYPVHHSFQLQRKKDITTVCLVNLEPFAIFPRFLLCASVSCTSRSIVFDLFGKWRGSRYIIF